MTWLAVLHLLLLVVSNEAVHQVRTTCSFPSVLWSRTPSNSDDRDDVITTGSSSSQRTWVSEEKHVSTAPAYESRMYVVAKETELLIVHHFATMCNGEPCVRTDSEKTMQCMTTEGSDKYRVRRRVNGFDDIVCLKFVIRSRNIVQLWTSRPSDTHMENLCSDTELRRNEWPWIAQNDIEWSPCPIVGGFDFRAYLNNKKTVCERIPRPSQLDVDCVAGDGLHFRFPDPICSIFHTTDTDYTLQCFGSWTEDSFTFIVASSGGRSPQYVLRLPIIPRLSSSSRPTSQQYQQFDGHMYYSPVCPLADNGLSASGQLMYMTLRLRRAEMSPIEDRSCDFPHEFRGNWLLMESRRPESVTIGSGVIQSPSVFGDVICKAKHWKMSTFKVVSAFSNGCRPRYTCIDFDLDEKFNVLRFRLSRSSRADHPFEVLCLFESDEPPLGSRFRSRDFKVLYPVSRTRQHSCGLDGLVRVTVTSQSMASASLSSMTSSSGADPAGERRACDGSLSDWNPFTCTLTSSMVLTYRNCTTDNALVHREYICEAFIDLQPDYRMLFVKYNDNGDENYSCWLIRMTSNGTSEREIGHHVHLERQRPPWLTVGASTRSACNELRNPIESSLFQHSSAAFFVLPEPRERQCIVMTKGARRQGPDVIRYYFKGKNVTKPFKAQSPLVAMQASAAVSSGAARATSSWMSTLRGLLLVAIVQYIARLF